MFENPHALCQLCTPARSHHLSLVVAASLADTDPLPTALFPPARHPRKALLVRTFPFWLSVRFACSRRISTLWNGLIVSLQSDYQFSSFVNLASQLSLSVPALSCRATGQSAPSHLSNRVRECCVAASFMPASLLAYTVIHSDQ